MERQQDGWMKGWNNDGQMDKWMDRQNDDGQMNDELIDEQVEQLNHGYVE